MDQSSCDFTKTSDWAFDIEEVSAGVYRVRGVDNDGRSVEMTGTDPDSILEQCKESAARISLKKNNP